jgi:hypothetical protein
VIIARRLSAFLATLFIAVAAYIVIGGLLGLPVFRSDISNDKKPQVVGCYQYRGRTIFRVRLASIAYGDNQHSTYDLISDKMGLAILPTRLLRLEMSKEAPPKVLAVPGAAELIPYDRRQDSLTFTTTGGEAASLIRGAC